MTTQDLLILTAKLKPDLTPFHLHVMAYLYRHQSATCSQISAAMIQKLFEAGLYTDESQVHTIQPDTYQIKHAIQKVRNRCYKLNITTRRVSGVTIYTLENNGNMADVMADMFWVQPEFPGYEVIVTAFNNYVDAMVNPVI